MDNQQRFRGTGRLEAFTDAVLAIVLTLLVIELLPKGAQSTTELLDDWPTYLAYLAAFFTIGTIWLNHNEQMSRVRYTDPIVLVLNLGLLLGASLLPWPTALISTALTEGDRSDQIAAIIVFAIVSCLNGAPWLILDLYLARNPHLLVSSDDAGWMRRHAITSIGALILAAVGVGLAFVLPLASLALYLLGVTVYLLSRLFERANPNAPQRAR